MVGLNLDVPRSEVVCSVFERLPMTVIVPTSWHVCGTDAEWSDRRPRRPCPALPRIHTASNGGHRDGMSGAPKQATRVRGMAPNIPPA